MISVFDSQTQPVDWQERTANANGYAELPGVPAVSDLFPAGTDYKMFVRATKTFSVTQGCCNAVSSFTREVTQQLTGLTGMTGGGIVNVTLVMPDVAAVTCGSLHGTVRSLLDNTVINGADVAIGTMSVRTTDMSGHYVITCNACSSCVKPAQAGFHDFQISKQGYYPKTQGNNWPYVNISQVEVVSNQSNMRDEKLFPRTFSTVNVTVFEGTALNPGPVIPGVMVNYYQYGSAPALEQVQTDSNGNAFFSNVIETWPPLGLTTQQLIDKGLSHYWEVHKFEALEQSGYKAENEANKNNWVVVHGTAVQVNLYLTKVPTT
jgi:hypothetical protein